MDGLDWWSGVGWWIGGLVDWWSGKLQLEDRRICKSRLARATAMGRRIIGMITIIKVIMIGACGSVSSAKLRSRS